MSLNLSQSAPGENPVRLEALFPASPERVFKAWSNADELAQWFGRVDRPAQTVEIEFRVGGTWRCSFETDDGAREVLHGQYLEIETNRRLVFSWIHQRIGINGEQTDTAASTVTVTFEAVASGSRVCLNHDAIVTEAGRRGVGLGWADSIHQLYNLLRRHHD